MPTETLKEKDESTTAHSQLATVDETSGSDEKPVTSDSPEIEAIATDGESLLKLIIQKQLQYFIDRTGEPCLVIPGDNPERAYPIQSRRAKAYIAALAWNSGNLMLTAAELKRVLRVLEGLAWEQCPRDATRDQIWNSLQDKPALQVLIEFMGSRAAHEALMHELLVMLREEAAKLKFDMYSKRWPKTAAHLSAQLRNEHHQGILEQCGILVDIKRNRDGAKVFLRSVTPRIPDDADRPSASPPASQDKSRPESNLPHRDAGDGEKKKLEDLIRRRIDQHPNPQADPKEK